MRCSDSPRSRTESQLDPWLVTQVDPQAREQIIANAIDMKLIDQEGMQKILEWDHLESGNRLLLMAELQSLKLEVDQEKLESLANDNDLVIASVASLLLARDGELAPLSNISARLAGASPSERLGVLQRLIEVIRIYKITSATPWLNELLDTDFDNDDLAYWGTFTLMSLNPELGRPHWNRMVGSSPTYRMRIMGALQFLEAELAPDADARARLRAGDDPLINRILDTAEARANEPAHHGPRQGADRHRPPPGHRLGHAQCP